MEVMHVLAATGASQAAGVTVGIMLFIAYWVPSIVAASRRVRNTGSVIVINLLLGWTVIGWAVALAMACRSADRPQAAAPVATTGKFGGRNA